MNSNNYCVILAGGKGRRLWPCSREEKPKQFIDFFGIGSTLLQTTYDRFAKIVPRENILVCTNKEYLSLVKQQLPNLPVENILTEPVSRNTAPSVAWAVSVISQKNMNAGIVVTPADLFVITPEAFEDNIKKGLDFLTSHDLILSLGIKPTRPEPGYGYIQRGNQTDEENIFEVKSFTEKPERQFAHMFMDNGEFYWNTGLFIASAKQFEKRFRELFPEQMEHITKMSSKSTPKTLTTSFENYFGSFPNMSIDYAILEHWGDVYIMTCKFGWADIGTWHSVYECMSVTNNDNVVIDSDVILDDCQNNVIKIEKGKLAIINGLDGYIVSQKGNILFICKKEDSSALVRKYVNEVQMKYGEDFI